MCKNLKLYVWGEDFMRDYTSGIAFAVASSVIDAKLAIVKEYGESEYIINFYRRWLENGDGDYKALEIRSIGQVYIPYIIGELEKHSFSVYDINKGMDAVAYCISGGS